MTLHDDHPSQRRATGAPARARESALGHAFPIGRLLGIEIRVTASWFVIALLIAYSLFAEFTLRFPDLSNGAAAALGLGCAAVFFASVVLHELAHSTAANHLGMQVSGITLFLLGGVSETTTEAESYRDEFVIAIVGPLTSFAIAASAWLVEISLGSVLGEPLAFGVGYIGWINLALGGFNLLPGLPLDGGRVLRSIAWRQTGDRIRATRIAATGGTAVGTALIGIGLLAFFGFLNVGGLWFAAIGWFLRRVANASVREALVQDLISGGTAGDLVSPAQLAITSAATVADVIDRFYLHYEQATYPVQHDGRIVGVIVPESIREVAEDQRSLLGVSQIMTPIEDVATVPADAPIGDVRRLLTGRDALVAVSVNSIVIGVITSHSLARWIQRRLELEPDRKQ